MYSRIIDNIMVICSPLINVAAINGKLLNKVLL